MPESVEDDDDSYMSEYTQPYEDEDDGITVEAVVEQFANNGYDLKDAISLLINKFSKIDTKYTEEYNLTMCEQFNNIIWELRLEHRNRVGMATEDRQAFDVDISPIRQIQVDQIPEPTQLPQHVSSAVMHDIINS
jgi:hypothetical protein